MPPLDVVGALVLRDGGAAELEASTTSCGTLCETDAPSTDCGGDPYEYDAPAESLRLRIGEDIDWSDVVVGGAVAAVLERDDSTKGAAANPKCAARRSAAAAARSSLSAPAARAAVAAVVIGGLPGSKAAHALDHGGRRRSPCRLQLQLGGGGGARVFASGEAAAGRHPAAEPGSPKVSCLGAVGVRSQPTNAAEGIASGRRRWWAWLVVADVMFCCCWKGRAPRQEADGERRSRVE